MVEFAKFLQLYVGPAVLVLLFGYLADNLSSDRLKADVVRWIGSTERIKINKANVSSVLTAFLNGFLYKIFGSQLFSLKFFVRSTAVFIVFLGLALVVQAVFYESFWEEVITSSSTRVSVVLFLSVFAFNIVIDYLSNVFSLSLLRMVSASGRVLDVVVVFFADLALTVTMFTLLFPIGMTIGIVVSEAIRPPTSFELKMSKESSFKIKTMLATAQPNLQLRAIDLNFLGDDGKASPSRGLKQAVLVSGDDDRQNVQDYAATVRSQYKKLDLQEVADEVTRANAQFRPIPFTRDAIKAIYYGAFVQGNVTRDEFLGIVSLAPTPISISGILGLVASYLSGQQIENGELLIKAKCEDGSLRYFSDTKEPPCAVKFASLSWTSDSLITERS